MSAALRAAHLAGTAVRVLRQPGRILPGLAGAVLVSAGLGQAAGNVFGHGLCWPVTCVAAGAFLLVIGREVNAGPAVPQREEQGDTLR